MVFSERYLVMSVCLNVFNVFMVTFIEFNQIFGSKVIFKILLLQKKVLNGYHTIGAMV